MSEENLSSRRGGERIDCVCLDGKGCKVLMVWVGKGLWRFCGRAKFGLGGGRLTRECG